MPYAPPRASEDPAAEGVGGPECDDRSKRTGGQEPIDNRNVNLPLHLAGGVKHPHAGEKAFNGET